MVTLITEQLRKQSLDESCQRSSPFHVNVSFPQVGSSPTVSWSPRKTTEDARLFCNPSPKAEPPDASCGHDSLWTSYHVGAPLLKPEVSMTDEALQSSPPPPPPKRQCRSLSVPEDLSRCRSAWHPSAFRIWTPVRSRCQSGSTSGSVSFASSFPLCRPRSSFNSQNSSSSPTFCSLAFSTDSPLSWDNCDTLNRDCSTSFATPSTCSSSPAPLIPQSALHRRFSLSPLHMQSMGFMSHQSPHKVFSPDIEQLTLSPSPSSACSTPSSTRRDLHPALPRCHSQPCDMRKPRLKRRRDSECFPVARPVLNFSKMKQIGAGETGEFAMPTWPRPEQHSPFSPADFFGRASIGPLSESEEDDCDEEKRTVADGEARVFQRDCSELDLNLIEEN
ncbi:protein FAM53C-like [Synchiropus splendidus]|uniref:protein FAM53C-like n=1 Tax=Synchiropus splendidus TaxID=270530 RepID=UPI00237D6BCF|nr:protein FAM53C-like [Synchiropus splendidus]XP_053734659.1 protein FAM53C-like [Synchiropus splendidus]